MTDTSDITAKGEDDLLHDLKALIDQGRGQAVAAVNSALTLTYWNVGRRDHESP